MAAIFEHGYALVVGIDDNKISRLALPTVAKDVQAVYDVLVHPERCAYQEDNVKLLSGADSTKNNILEAFMWLKEKVKADADATAVIYYSGHGYRDTATEEYYLIPYDFQSVARVRIDALQAELVAAEIAEIKSPRVLVILDCCHAEGMQVKNLDFADGPELKSVAFPEDASLTKNLP
ncbi:MAG: caspase family protein, partial [Anaerolineales bacterium]|nr:caspase family protein [Anaerolineales bacterium]